MTGRGNYKVQDVVSHWVFVSQDIIFEESQPHRTSASVRENIPIFDTNIIPPTNTRPDPNPVDIDNAARQSDNDFHQNPVDPVDHNHVNLPNIPAILMEQ